MNQDALTELNKRTAYYKNEPMTDASHMTLALDWERRDDEWKEWSKQKFWSTHFDGVVPDISDEVQEHLNLLLSLRDKLLTFGGEQAIIQLEENVDKMLDRGQFWYGDRSGLIEGYPSSCHYNASALWESLRDTEKTIHIATGYALSKDGLWRQHTWCVLEKEKENIILETTVGRIGYFGFVLTEEESEKFVYENT